jgi:FkbM family methyltransferase
MPPSLNPLDVALFNTLNKDCQMITEPAFSDALATSRPLLLYGAGATGQDVANRLAKHKFEIAAFLDAKAKPGECRCGIPLFKPAEWTSHREAENSNVLVTIHNFAINVANIIDQLRQIGFVYIFTMVDYVTSFPGELTNGYWLSPRNYYDDKSDVLLRFRECLSDSISLQWFDALVNLRTKGDYHGLPAPMRNDQYIAADLPRWSDPMRLIDCGAYDGDSLQLFLQGGYHIDAAVAIEPDLQNYAKLSSRFQNLNVTYIPCGVSSKAETVNFFSGDLPASRIGTEGECTVQCISIDQAFPEFRPSLIKMDIEGAELAALHGAEKTIRRFRPELAIAIYHTPEHFTAIPLWIAALGLGYRMYLRGHNHGGYDSVLYCL